MKPLLAIIVLTLMSCADAPDRSAQVPQQAASRMSPIEHELQVKKDVWAILKGITLAQGEGLPARPLDDERAKRQAAPTSPGQN